MVVFEELLLGGRLVNCEPRIVGVELVFLAPETGNFALVWTLFVRPACAINFGPWLPCVGGRVDVDELCSRHPASGDVKLSGESWTEKTL